MLQSIEINSMCKFLLRFSFRPFPISHFSFLFALYVVYMSWIFIAFIAYVLSFCLLSVVFSTFCSRAILYVLYVLSCVPTNRQPACSTSLIWSIVTISALQQFSSKIEIKNLKFQLLVGFSQLQSLIRVQLEVLLISIYILQSI